MLTPKQSTTKRLKMAERAQQLMDVHFPGMSPAYLWHRKKNDGYISIPRTLPIVMQAIDMLSKGQPAGHTLFCLWARSPDHPVVTIENPSTFASEAGFTGERAVDTWRRRMKTLEELWFIRAKPGPSGDFHYVLLTNPNAVVEYLRSTGRIQDGLYGRFVDRAAEIGAHSEIVAAREAMAAQAAANQAAVKQAQESPAAAATAAFVGTS
ncbi:hypothetical protein FAZ69_04560 [Trinickia terrae]|uniref:Uncharacterized protein n=1 Tax=Trinickia terrae TaxID=2571161 RepID=A0A4U1IDJ5_9BURK|nr:hypothetical protein [Trinickia terrae]TKC91718.1 hypothetical protein FAZ69_04560 [Trinickia terrae]